MLAGFAATRGDPIDTSDYYAALGLAPDASREEIMAARRRTLRTLHPDANAAPEAAERFDEAYKMFAVLCDPERRAAYDRARAPANTGPATLLMCRDCGGAGVSAIIVCETCGGSGRSSFGFSPNCTACDGMGRLGIVCELCHGAGWR